MLIGLSRAAALTTMEHLSWNRASSLAQDPAAALIPAARSRLSFHGNWRGCLSYTHTRSPSQQQLKNPFVAGGP